MCQLYSYHRTVLAWFLHIMHIWEVIHPHKKRHTKTITCRSATNSKIFFVLSSHLNMTALLTEFHDDVIT